MEWKCHGWEAWHEQVGTRVPTLYVSGECTFPTTGYVARLDPHTPQGNDPRDLLLDLVVQVPTGPVNEVETAFRVQYTKRFSPSYDTVSIVDVAAGIPVRKA